MPPQSNPYCCSPISGGVDGEIFTCYGGNAVVCQRAAFNGDPSLCCMQDVDCQGREYTGAPGQNPLCFTDLSASGQNYAGIYPNVYGPGGNPLPNTCDPKYRDISSPACGQPVADFCLGTDLPASDTSWLGRWVGPAGSPAKGGCLYALQRRLFSVGGTAGICTTGPLPAPGAPCGSLFGGPGVESTIKATSQGVLWASDLMGRVLEKYQRQGFVLGTPPGTAGYSPFQDFLYENVCCPYPAVCQGALAGYCRRFSGQRVSLSPLAARLCGCHLAPQAYQSYTTRYQISPACTPTCTYPGTVPQTDASGAPVSCTQNVCLIDDLTINLAQSSVGGDISISQFCSNCASGAGARCSCIVQDETLDAVSARIGKNILTGTECSQTTCQKRVNGVTVAAPCGETPESQTNPATSQSWRARVAIGAGVFLLGALAVFLALFFFSGRR